MEIPNEGKYVCKLNGQLVIYEASTGSLCGAVPCVMVGSATPAYDGFTFKHTMVLVKSDGTIQTRTTDTLKAVFGWDGVDPFWLMDESAEGGALRSIEFEIVGGPETGDKGGQYFKSQWLNPLGGGMKTPVAADRRSVLARYGSKFAALANVGGRKTDDGGRIGAETRVEAGEGNNNKIMGTKSWAEGVRPVPTAPSGAQGTARPTLPLPVGPPQGATATMEEAWAALNEANVGKAPAEMEKLWFDTIARLFPNKTNTELRPHEWGKLKGEFADNVPM